MRHDEYIGKKISLRINANKLTRFTAPAVKYRLE